MNVDEELQALRVMAQIAIDRKGQPSAGDTAELLELASRFQALDLWLSNVAQLPVAWTEGRSLADVIGAFGELRRSQTGAADEEPFVMPEASRATIDCNEEALADPVVEAFMAIRGPMSVPTDFAEAKALLSKLLEEQSEYIGRRASSGLDCWRVLVENNGEYRFYVQEEQVVECSFRWEMQ